MYHDSQVMSLSIVMLKLVQEALRRSSRTDARIKKNSTKSWNPLAIPKPPFGVYRNKDQRAALVQWKEQKKNIFVATKIT